MSDRATKERDEYIYEHTEVMSPIKDLDLWPKGQARKLILQHNPDGSVSLFAWPKDGRGVGLLFNIEEARKIRSWFNEWNQS